MRTSRPVWVESQPKAGGLPPLVLMRWMLVARENTAAFVADHVD